MADDKSGTIADSLQNSADEDLELLGFDSHAASKSKTAPPSPEAESDPATTKNSPANNDAAETFGRVLKAEATRAGLTNDALASIPEAVVVDTIPEAMPADSIPMARQRREIISTRRRRNPAGGTGQLRRIAKLPDSRNVEDEVSPPIPQKPSDINRERFLSMDEAKEGNFRANPLERNPSTARNAPSRSGRAKFLDGELPRNIERGVTYPFPGILIFTSFVLVVTKLLLFVNIVALPLISIISPESFAKFWWLPASFMVFGALFLLSANRTRCKVCTCHLFFKRNCHIHNKAHRVPLFGAPASAALHLLLFRWLRCMYCGTAIRVRKPNDQEKAVMDEEITSPAPQKKMVGNEETPSNAEPGY